MEEETIVVWVPTRYAIDVRPAPNRTQWLPVLDEAAISIPILGVSSYGGEEDRLREFERGSTSVQDF